MNTDILSPGSPPTPNDYLAVTSLTDSIFLLGLLDRGVTIFNQQVRALNLIWALDRADRLRSAPAIAVVGGGIAGLTAAMALRKIFSLTPDLSDRTVTFFEQRSVLCPLQRGCATRWVHPHIYDWPEPGSTNPSAGLPIMNWRAGRASDVATTIVAEWESESARTVEQWRNLQYLKIDHKNCDMEWVGERFVDAISRQVLGKKRRFNIIILAVGFGEERGSSKHLAVSYWRNETYAQPDLSGRQQRYLVSGTGDGGLVDLLRLRIADFREDRIGHQLAPEGFESYRAVQELRATCYRNPHTQGAELFDRARQLGSKLKLVDYINRNLRADTVASLQIRDGKRVSDAFRGKSSFVNRFLVSLLFEAGGFSPRFGDIESVGSDGFDEVIVRHGPDTDRHLKSTFSEDISSLLDDLKKRRDDQKSIDLSEHKGFWETGWPFDRKTGSGPGSAKRDYVPDATIAVSSAFVSALAPIFSLRGGKYRATLHRIVGTQSVGEVHLQQIAHYHGPRAETKLGDNVVGRLFKINDAVIGLAARSRKVLTTRPQDHPEGELKGLLHKDMQHLNGENWDPKRMDDDVCALFACPLISKSDAGADPVKSGKVVAVLFADSTLATAFDDETVSQIVAACEEFGRYLQSIAQNQAPELISVKSQATYYAPEVDNAAEFKELSILTPSEIQPPCVPVEYINLDWWTESIAVRRETSVAVDTSLQKEGE